MHDYEGSIEKTKALNKIESITDSLEDTKNILKEKFKHLENNLNSILREPVPMEKKMIEDCPVPETKFDSLILNFFNTFDMVIDRLDDIIERNTLTT